MKNDSTYKRKFAFVMREGYGDRLHMGRSGRVVPKDRPDIMKAIAASEARKAGKGKALKRTLAR